MSPREPLPPADYAYVLIGSDLLPAVVLRRGWFWSRALVFRPFDGSKARRVRSANIVAPAQANALLAFRRDPLAVLHMVGEDQ